jgi:hypothetical protein
MNLMFVAQQEAGPYRFVSCDSLCITQPVPGVVTTRQP